MKNLKDCRIGDFDDIFYATKESQGYNNALLAIKYVLFDDESVFDDETPEGNKYLYISSKNNARKKSMLLQTDDLAHILVKYCMASFGLRGKDFTITEDEFLLNRRRIDRLELTPYEMIEFIAYAAMGDINLAYELLYANKKNLINIVEYMIEERYISEFKESIDEFSGLIDNKDMNEKTRYNFYNAYNNLDEEFESIKRNNKDYIK